MGAPRGNLNATKNRRWAQAIDKALKQYNEGDIERGQALDTIAVRLVRNAIQGDTADFKDAIREIGDRIDGKALASIDISGELSVTDLTTSQLDARLKELTGE